MAQAGSGRRHEACPPSAAAGDGPRRPESADRLLAEPSGRAPSAPAPRGSRGHRGEHRATGDGDPTWQLAVLRSATSRCCHGVYGDDPSAALEPSTDLHRWARPPSPPMGPAGARAPPSVAMGRLHGGRRGGQRGAERHPAGALGGPWRPVAVGAGPLRADRPAGGNGDRPRAALRPGAGADRGAEPDGRHPDRLPARRDPRSPDAAHQHPRGGGRAWPVPDLDEAARTDLDTIAQQADRLRRMVGQLLAVSRLEVGALTPAQEVLRRSRSCAALGALRADRRSSWWTRARAPGGRRSRSARAGPLGRAGQRREVQPARIAGHGALSASARRQGDARVSD